MAAGRQLQNNSMGEGCFVGSQQRVKWLAWLCFSVEGGLAGRVQASHSLGLG